jgi:hypothetical protein
MPALAAEFRATAKSAVGLPEAGETVREVGGQGTIVRRELTPLRLMALYEMAYLRMFVAWESFLEETFLRTMCGYESAQYIPIFKSGQSRQPNLKDAFQALLFPGQDYLLWHNPKRIKRWAESWFDQGPHELVIASNLSRLEWLGAIRHRIAHGSKDARTKMDKATTGLAGRRYAGSSPGRFLRSWNEASQPRERWLYTIRSELSGLAGQISP